MLRKYTIITVCLLLVVYYNVYVIAQATCQDNDKHGEFCHHNLHPTRINKNIKNMEYAVRGKLVIRADEIQNDLKQNPEKYKFKEVVFCNIGNPQGLGQKPLTFPSQVMALLNYPPLLNLTGSSFTSDVKKRAQVLLDNIPGGLGAYSHSQGVAYIRQKVAEFIERRDGFSASTDHIFLTNGASPAIKFLIRLLSTTETDTFLLPNPQYPLYSASVQEAGSTALPYSLDEQKGWSMDVEELEQRMVEGKRRGLNIRALVVINPGNPIGQVLSEENMKDIVLFCVKHGIVLLADEVYQANVYGDIPFTSFKKVYMQMYTSNLLDSFRNQLELFSFHSVSKGLHGECGRRGGYLEAVNTHPTVLATIYKLASVSLCANTAGQVMVELMVNPPRPGDESYPLYKEETDSIYQSLKRRASKLVSKLNQLEGVSVQAAAGSMYVFPQITVPADAVQEAKNLGMTPDEHYCVQVLENTGLVVVPGSGFLLEDEKSAKGEKRYFFRSTFLPPEDKIDAVMQRWGDFHSKYMEHYNS